MSSGGGGATGQTRLTVALDDFKSQLDTAGQASFGQTSQPDVTVVTEFCANFNDQSNLRRKRLGDKIKPFLLFIQSFGDVVGVYIQSDPKIAALVWGSVKLVVQIASNYFEYFVKISDMFIKLQHLCPTISRIGKLFQSSNKLQDAVIGFYAIIVEFCTKAFVFLKQPGIKQFAKSIWSPFKVYFTDVEAQLEDQRRIIDDEVLIASETAAHEAAQSALIYQKYGYKHREFEVEQWAGNKNWQLQQDFEAKRRRLSRILENISVFDHTRSFMNARDRRHPETGKWFFALPSFSDWCEARDSSILWFHGIPGSGKSILATSIVDFLYSQRQSSGLKTSIIYFFCDFNIPEALRYRTVLSSLLKQIVVLNGTLSDDAQEELQKSYIDSALPPDIYRIEELIIMFARKLSQLYILIDGIDECSIDDSLKVLALVKKFLAKLPQNLKIILSSRPDIDIPKSLKVLYSISLSTTKHRPDLEAYIEHEIEAKCPNLEVYPPEVKEDIKQALLKGADGMFLWVFFQLQDIRRAGNRGKIESILCDLPRGLHETYARIMHRIYEDRDASEAGLAFKWLSECHRPLTLLELRDAIAIRIGDTKHAQIRSRYNENPEGIIHNCCGLVIVNEQDQTVQYAHSTVAKYLEARKIEISQGETEPIGEFASDSVDIADLCATYLRLGDFGTQIGRTKKPIIVQPPKDWVNILLPGKLSFLAPACRFTLDMVLGSHNQSQLSTNLFTPEGLYRSVYTESKPVAELAISQDFPCLKYIAEYWLHHFAEGRGLESRAQSLEILLHELDLPFPYLPGMIGFEKPGVVQLLSWACENDNVPLLAVLFSESKGSYYKSIKSSESVGRNLDMTGVERDAQLLLKYAVERGSSRVVEYFLEDPPINLRGGTKQIRESVMNTRWCIDLRIYQRVICQYDWIVEEEHENSPLFIAAKFGRLQIFEQLLLLYETSEKMNADYLSSVMEAAAINGHLDIVKTLFPSTQHLSGTDCFKCLVWAVRSGNQEVVEYFLSHLESLNLLDFQSPNCQKKIQRIMRLAGEIIIDQEDFAYHFGVANDPLVAAVKENHLEILRLIGYRQIKAAHKYAGQEGQVGRLLVPVFREAIISSRVEVLDILEQIGLMQYLRPGVMACPCEQAYYDISMDADRYSEPRVKYWLSERGFLRSRPRNDSIFADDY